MVTDEVVHLGGLIDGGSDRLTDIGTSVLGQACREDIWRGVDADGSGTLRARCEIC
ncbi:hypothetical protein [Brachybacterium sp. AG952]|uniref:hypothetical protein n=1 Tax=Brachybacterium sp. AG952 TaxID=2183989 RepID=UPI0014152505|nr:hypothetical protein [Brachybacterium sp. AG952]